MITDEEAERAVDYLRDSAPKAAQARANKEYVSEFRKVLKAQIMRENPSDPIGTQEAKAYSDPRYQAHLQAIKEAVEADAHAVFLRDAAQARIDAWRSQESSRRAGLA
jgi:hypothetical protein